MNGFEIKPIRTEEEYEMALRAISPLFEEQHELGTPESDFIIVVSMLIEEYEKIHYPIEPPDPIEAIKFRMEQMGLTAKDLEPAIGHSGRVSEILNRKRSLTLPMIRKLHAMFKIPVESLIGA
jgi:HTH-type transcriptional regulator / antitoxin HigA